MRSEEAVVLMIKGAIEELSPAEAEQCKELAEHIRRMRKQAGEPSGTLAVALVGAEIQAEME